MAVFDDFDGVYFTTQCLLAYHSDRIGQIVIVDNNPKSKQGERVKRYAASIKATYVALDTPKGTAAPRDAIFTAATQEWVVVLDSHVIVEAGFFSALDIANSDDLFHGTLVYDWGQLCATHMVDEWGGELWGRWGRAEVNQDGKAFERVGGRTLDIMTQEAVTVLSSREPTEPFEIPAHGMGMWACRKDSWLGFNPAFREFGGEEWYIHIKYRQKGRKVICIPQARWRHRFSDLTAHTIPYPLTRLAKVKNYCIGHAELGIDTDRLYREFVGRGLITQQQWCDMGCGCNKAAVPQKTTQPIPASMKVAPGEVIDFTLDTEWPEAENLLRLTDPLKDGVMDTNTLVLDNKAFALGRWADKADRILVRGSTEMVLPFLHRYQSYTLAKNEAGWILLSRLDSDKHAVPGMFSTITTGLFAAARAVKTSIEMRGLPLVSEATQEARMNVCLTCPHRTDDRCSQCGCYVAKKTWVAKEECPLGFWK